MLQVEPTVALVIFPVLALPLKVLPTLRVEAIPLTNPPVEGVDSVLRHRCEILIPGYGHPCSDPFFKSGTNTMIGLIKRLQEARPQRKGVGQRGKLSRFLELREMVVDDLIWA